MFMNRNIRFVLTLAIVQKIIKKNKGAKEGPKRRNIATLKSGTQPSMNPCPVAILTYFVSRSTYFDITAVLKIVFLLNQMTVSW